MTLSQLTHLECTLCGAEYDADKLNRTCPDDAKPLFARYDLQKAGRTLTRQALVGREANMWRYSEVMPVRDQANVITLGEGWTPIIDAKRLATKVGINRLLVKDEGLNPTGSFKARGLSAAVSRASELGARKLTMPSAGNAAGAMSAYAAAGGLEAHVFMPRDAPSANRIECEAYGAEVVLVDGFITDAGRVSQEAAAKHGYFDVSTLREPYRAEGKKTMGYEIVEQLGWQIPDVIVYPTGGGTGIVGIWKALDEMEAMGLIGPERPRMICVQAEGCSPIVNAYRTGERFAEPVPNPSTIAAGMRVPAAVGDFLVIQAVVDSRGTALTVTDADMIQAVRELAEDEGIFAAPEGGSTLAALKSLLKSGDVKQDELVLLLNTGSALKYLDVLAPHFAAT